MENKVLKLGGGGRSTQDIPITLDRGNPTKKYPLDLNFYWVAPT